MTPQEMEQKIIALEAVIKAMGNSNLIPFDVDQAFRDRLGIGDIPVVQVDAKSASSEDQAVNEGGAATYNVLKSPDGWLSLEIEGTTYVVPHYGSS